MNYEEIMKQLEYYFCDLVILQYRNSIKNREFIKELVNIVFANNLALKIKELCVDVEKSEGVQQDVVGRWVGIDRFYTGFDIWDKNYFSLPSYSNIKNNSYNEFMGGFSNYTNFNTLKGAFLTYRRYIDTHTANNEMGKEIFKQIIKLKIIKNSIVQTNKSIDEAIYKWSNGKVYTTWENKMVVTYNFKKEYKTIMNLAQYKNVLLAPCGCKIELKEVA